MRWPFDTRNFSCKHLLGQLWRRDFPCADEATSLFRYRRTIKKIPRAKPHQFRHAFASDLARAGVPLTTIQKLLGHSDPATTEVYVKLFIEDIRIEYERAMKRIEVRYASLKN